ncbi:MULTISPECIES: GNAT family N-acetyltransferase [unclassified Streptomyces]|uniref:GNAT family N-acetyltransferase n=1 Tax=unclassified Streptomyces TaxID=2593676 RepID=UPI0037FE83FA
MTTRPTPAHAPEPLIRDMTIDDCEAVSAVRVRGWRSAYAGLMPQAYLDAMSVTADAERRRGYFTEGNEVVNVVAERAGLGVIGWAAYGPYRENGARLARGELYAIYVLPELTGRGVGRALLSEVLARAGAAGHPDLALWVLRENAPARRFYARAGFRPDGAQESFEVDGVPVPEVRYVRRLAASEGR